MPHRGPGRHVIHSAVISACLTLGTVAPAMPRDDHPQWGERYTRNMVSDEKGLPDRFDVASGLNVKWTAALGTDTHGSPVIAGGRVLIGTNNGRPRDPKHKGDRGVLMCFDERDGKFLWQLVVPKRGDDDPYLDWPEMGITSTPTVDGDRVYVMDNRGEVLCLDLKGMANGNDGPFKDEGAHMTPAGSPPLQPGPTDADILWIFDLVSGAGVYTHDSTCASILLYGSDLYLNSVNGVDNTHRKIRAPDAPSLVVLEAAEGKYVARDDERIGPRIFHCTWSPPALGVVNGRPQVIFCGGDGVVYAFEPRPAGTKAGPALLKRIWRFDCDPTGPKENVHRFTGNIRESPSVIHGAPVFHKNRVYVTVGGDLWWGKAQCWLKCIDATGAGDVTRTAERWSYPLNKHVMATPAVRDGLVYAADTAGTVHCVDAETGRPCWTHDASGEIWASPMVADGKVYVATRRGQVLIFAAGRTKKLLFSADLGEPISATPVAANSTLYIATMSRLFALRSQRAVHATGLSNRR